MNRKKLFCKRVDDYDANTIISALPDTAQEVFRILREDGLMSIEEIIAGIRFCYSGDGSRQKEEREEYSAWTDWRLFEECVIDAMDSKQLSDSWYKISRMHGWFWFGDMINRLGDLGLIRYDFGEIMAFPDYVISHYVRDCNEEYNLKYSWYHDYSIDFNEAYETYSGNESEVWIELMYLFRGCLSPAQYELVRFDVENYRIPKITMQEMGKKEGYVYSDEEYALWQAAMWNCRNSVTNEEFVRDRIMRCFL